jgi:hypothetical protein
MGLVVSVLKSVLVIVVCALILLFLMEMGKPSIALRRVVIFDRENARKEPSVMCVLMIEALRVSSSSAIIFATA